MISGPRRLCVDQDMYTNDEGELMCGYGDKDTLPSWKISVKVNGDEKILRDEYILSAKICLNVWYGMYCIVLYCNAM